ncbi:MAG: family 43 glycosylhydrolase [Kiritimatiellia bacterium]
MKAFVRNAVALCMLAGLGPLQAAAPDPKGRVPFADPFILLDGGTYYAYGTCSENGIGVAVSANLETWRLGVGRSAGNLALDKADSFGDKWFWAPEVYRIGDRYVMYYSADLHVCAAVADSPLGPFRQTVREPLFAAAGTIDNSLFFDTAGRPWMVFVKFDHGNVICLAEMEPDCLRVKPGTVRRILSAEAPWERSDPRCRIAEGPFVIYEKGRYVLTYSANDYRDVGYGVGFATAARPEGPWTKSPLNPILQGNWGLKGTGHQSLFRDRQGKWRMAFHAHNGATPDRIHPRCLHIAELEIGGAEGRPELRVGTNLVTCTVERPAGYRLLWSDEFDGTALDATRWNRCEQGGSDWNRHMSARSDLVEVKDGALVLWGVANTDTNADPRPFVTGGVQSNGKGTVGLGKVEIRAKFEDQRGAWPALWMLPDQKDRLGRGWPWGGEIDIVERLNGDDFIYQTAHSGWTVAKKRGTMPPQGGKGKIRQGEWNTYAVEITPSFLIWSVNGVETFRYPRIDCGDGDQWPFGTPFYVLMDMQLGGKWVGAVDLSTLPVRMYVDWIRVYGRL